VPVITRVLLIALVALLLYSMHLVLHMTNMAMTRLDPEDGSILLVDVFPHGGLSYRKTSSLVTNCLRVATGVTVALAVSLLWPSGKSQGGRSEGRPRSD
jgi:mannose/fructose-specific phosphotransferase system component IIA